MSQNYTTQPTQSEPQDYYELLQVSPTADPETIHRVYRLLAQRFHPDNSETGNASRFRADQRSLHHSQQPRGARALRHPARAAEAGALEARVDRHACRERLRHGAERSPDGARGAVHEAPNGSAGAGHLLDRARGDDRPAARAPRIHDLVSGSAEIRDSRRQAHA